MHICLSCFKAAVDTASSITLPFSKMLASNAVICVLASALIAHARRKRAPLEVDEDFRLHIYVPSTLPLFRLCMEQKASCTWQQGLLVIDSVLWPIPVSQNPGRWLYLYLLLL